MVASRVPPSGDLAHSPGMCPDQESNQQSPGLQASTPSTEPHQPGLIASFFETLETIDLQCALLVLYFTSWSFLSLLLVAPYKPRSEFWNALGLSLQAAWFSIYISSLGISLTIVALIAITFN